jgi:hypothetical protein
VSPTTTSTPANRPRPGNLTTPQKLLVGIAVTLVTVIAGVGFAGSYAAVSHLAAQRGFGRFARVFPLGLDAGIGAFLALDLLLTWLRIPFPLLRYGAWLLTIATVSFNAAAAWPDPLGVGMHAVIPVLFVIAVEAARHAVGRIADITADKHIELPPLKRWMVAPWPTFRLWRRQLMWNIRSYEDAITAERERKVYRARLRARYGRSWRRKAAADELLVLTLFRDGLTIADALALPEPPQIPLSASVADNSPAPEAGDPTPVADNSPTPDAPAAAPETPPTVDLAPPTVAANTPASVDRTPRQVATPSPTPAAAPVGRKTDRKTAKTVQHRTVGRAPRRSMDEWVDLAGPIFHDELHRRRRQPTASEFAKAIEDAGHGRVSDSTAKNIRTEILDRTDVPALDQAD